MTMLLIFTRSLPGRELVHDSPKNYEHFVQIYINYMTLRARDKNILHSLISYAMLVLASRIAFDFYLNEIYDEN